MASYSSIVQTIIEKAIRSYQLCISPFFPMRCRFYPSCSEYAQQAIKTYGVIRGAWKIVWRLLRCHPFCKGGYDPLPLTKPKSEYHGGI